jgi:PncC family amidohydrolase
MVDLAAAVLQALRDRGWTLATAESCTGGLLGDTLTDVAGSSDGYLGGVIAYSNAVKIAHLGVPELVLNTVGAVSAETAQAMAVGVRTRFNATVGLSTTGIAGPGGATPGKPVGLVYLGLALPDGVSVERHIWHADRRGNKTASAERAFSWLLAQLGR